MNLDHRISRWVLAGLLLGIPPSIQVANASATTPTKAPIRGHWVASGVAVGTGEYVSGIGPFCTLFTRDLNRFRTLRFNTCNPRLAKGYPLRRPHWTKIPWNRALARDVLVMTGVTPDSPGYRANWHAWLKQTEALRRAGQVHLWRTTVDLLHNGQRETLIRLDHVQASGIVIRAGRVVSPLPHYCGIVDSQLYMLPTDPPRVAQEFNRGGEYVANDVIEDTQTHRHYLLDWWRGFAIGGTAPTGATANVVVSTFYDAHDPTAPGVIPNCYINWVPVARHKRPTRSAHSIKPNHRHPPRGVTGP